MLVCVHCQRDIYLLVYFKCAITAVNTENIDPRFGKIHSKETTHTHSNVQYFIYLVINFKQQFLLQAEDQCHFF